MNRRDFLGTLAAGSLHLGLNGPVDSARALERLRRGAAERPNIILIMADDLGFSDVGCYGSEIRTPNIDGLAARGLRFSQVYNAARCVPTRASLLTGLFNHKAGLGHMMSEVHPPHYLGHLRDEAVTIAEVLGRAGYRTAMAGKWHLSHLHVREKEQLDFNSNAPWWDTKASWPVARGFHDFYGTIAGVNNFFDPFSLVHGETLTRPESDDFYYTDAINEYAAGVVERHARAGEPFFLYVAHTAPHWPLHALPEDIARYDGVYDVGWDRIRAARYERLVAEGLIRREWRLTPRDADVPAWADAPHKEWQARRMATHAAMIDRMDQGIGRILAKVTELGIEENTVVIFLSDNGASPETPLPRWYDIPSRTRDGREIRVGNDSSVMPGPEDTFASIGYEWANAANTPFRLYKKWTHEGGIATPFLVRWPAGIRRPGATTHEVGHIIDVMATVLDAAGVEYPREVDGRKVLPLDGRSLLPVIQGREREPHPVLGWEHEGHRGVRVGDLKLVTRHRGDWELYDMAADRTELNDLSRRYPQKAEQLKREFAAWAKRTGALPWSEYVEIRRRRTST